MRQPHALRFAGGAGGVDDGRKVMRLDAVDAVDHHTRILGEVGPTEFCEIVESDHPVAVTRAVDHDDLGDIRKLTAMLKELVDLRLVFCDDDAAS